MNRAAFYSKGDKVAFWDQFLTESGAKFAIYVYPKNRAKEISAPSVDGCAVFPVTYEDLTKTREWLHINSMIGESTALLLENPSRYAKITSPKVAALQRLEKSLSIKAIADIVPFTIDVQYLYTPLSYLGRDILGYPHYYAFRENYHERCDDGIVKASHDFDVLAPKVATVANIDYGKFLMRDRHIVEHECTADEQSQYDALRNQLFEGEQFSPQVTITKLADLVHSFESRLTAMLDCLKQCQGRTVVYCNLASYAKKAGAIAKKNGFKNVVATSYQVGTSGEFDNCIYLESPIVKSYLLLDAESRLSNARVFHVVGSSKVDKYLFGLTQHETTQIDEFTQELSRVFGTKTKPEAVPSAECARSSSGTYQMDLFNLFQGCCVG